MTVVLDGGTGYFDSHGKLANLMNDIDSGQGTLLSDLEALIAKTTTTEREAASAILGDAARLQAIDGPKLERIFEAAEAMTIEIVDADTDAKLDSRTVEAAILELKDQMRAAAEGLEHTVSTKATAADAGNTGVGQIVADITDFEAEPLPYMFTEVLRVKCVRDAQEGTRPTAAGAEEFVIIGESPLSREDANWPAGSGARQAIVAARAADDAQKSIGANLLTNSDFENFTAGLPDRWLAVTGTATTHFDETATAYIGSKALQFIGDGSTLTEIRQVFGGSTGTERTLKPNTKYGMGFWYRMDTADALASGALRVQIQSGSTVLSVTPTHTGTAVNARITVDLTSSPSVTYAFASATFTTPADIPASLEVAIELTSAITAGREVFIDELVVQELTQAYPGGPYIGLFRGSTDFVLGDLFTVTITQNDDNNELSWVMNRMLGLQEKELRDDGVRQRPLGLIIPTLGTPTISDALIA